MMAANQLAPLALAVCILTVPIKLFWKSNIVSPDPVTNGRPSTRTVKWSTHLNCVTTLLTQAAIKGRLSVPTVLPVTRTRQWVSKQTQGYFLRTVHSFGHFLYSCMSGKTWWKRMQFTIVFTCECVSVCVSCVCWYAGVECSVWCIKRAFRKLVTSLSLMWNTLMLNLKYQGITLLHDIESI